MDGPGGRRGRTALPAHRTLVSGHAYAAPADATLAVLQQYPEAAKEKVPEGWLPLHGCCPYAAPAEATRAVLQQLP